MELAHRLKKLNVENICGPLVEGSFIALLVAAELNVGFSYSERFSKTADSALFPAGYRIPEPLRDRLKGQRVAIVNDVINAGSAVRGTYEDLEACGATVTATGTLLTLGTAAQQFATAKQIPLETLATLPNSLWLPSDCPLCASGMPLQDIAGFSIRHG